MKKRYCIIFCLMLIIPVISLNTEAQDGPSVWWTSVKGGKGITAVMKNKGDETVYNITYRIILSGDLIIKNAVTIGTIDVIAPGEEVTITAEPYGFGRVQTGTLDFFPFNKTICFLNLYIDGYGGYGANGLFFFVIGNYVIMLPKILNF